MTDAVGRTGALIEIDQADRVGALTRDEQLALETIAAAAEAGVTVFDTAHAYGLGESELGHNERLVARALRRCGAEGRARIVTKGGMARTGGAWVPDGRDCAAPHPARA